MAIDWTRGYSPTWRLFRVNENTWADSDLLGGFHSARVERDGSDGSSLIESGSMTVDASTDDDFEDGYYRLAMTAHQDGITERVDVATLRCSSASGTVDRSNNALTVKGRSVLFPAYTERLIRGTYAPKGVDGVDFVADMLSKTLKAPVEAQGSFTLDQHVVFDLGARVVDAAWSVLKAGGWCIQIGGNGTVELLKKPAESSLSLDAAHARLLMPSVSHELDWSSVPNRYVAVDGQETAMAINDDEASPTSTVTRGYIQDADIDTSPVRVNGETLTAYCNRKLEEESVVKDTRTYTREYWPGVVPFSIVSGSIASVKLDGDLRITSQSLVCDSGITVTEKACKEVRAWQAR